MVGLASVPVWAAPPKQSSETSAAQVCLAFERESEDLLGWCQSALLEPGVSQRDLERIQNNLGWLASELTGPEASRAAYRKTLAMNPLNAEAMAGLGWAYWDEDAYDEAAAQFRQAADINTTAEYLGGLGSSLWRGGAEPEPSVELLERALLIDPDYGWAARELAWLHEFMGNLDKAEASFDQALRVDGDDAHALFGKADLRITQDRLDEALELLNHALSIRVAPDFLTYRAFIMNERANYRQAVEDAARALELAPGDGDAARQKARAHEELGHLDLARDTYAGALNNGAEGAFFFSEYAHVLYLQDDLDTALQMVDASLERAQDNWAHSLRAVILRKLDRFDAAIDAAERAVALDEDYAFPHITIALSQIALGEMDAALEAAQTAQGLGVDEDEINDLIRQLVADGQILDAIRFRAALQK